MTKSYFLDYFNSTSGPNLGSSPAGPEKPASKIDKIAWLGASILGVGFLFIIWSWFAGVSDCSIKGNISANGEKIYHLKESKFYTDTAINLDKGEKYFCNEGEAKAAGFRRSML